MKRLDIRRWLVGLMRPTIAQVGDVVLLPSGRAYQIQSDRLVQMRVVSLHQLRGEK